MGIILWIIFGAVVGWIASMVRGTNARMGLLANILIGIIGSLIGGLIMNALGYSGITGFNLYSILVAILGSVILIWLIQQISKS